MEEDGRTWVEVFMRVSIPPESLEARGNLFANKEKKMRDRVLGGLTPEEFDRLPSAERKARLWQEAVTEMKHLKKPTLHPEWNEDGEAFNFAHLVPLEHNPDFHPSYEAPTLMEHYWGCASNALDVHVTVDGDDRFELSFDTEDHAPFNWMEKVTECLPLLKLEMDYIFEDHTLCGSYTYFGGEIVKMATADVEYEEDGETPKEGTLFAEWILQTTVF